MDTENADFFFHHRHAPFFFLPELVVSFFASFVFICVHPRLYLL
jgi:hypothetical protein